MGKAQNIFFEKVALFKKIENFDGQRLVLSNQSKRFQELSKCSSMQLVELPTALYGENSMQIKYIQQKKKTKGFHPTRGCGVACSI